MNVAMVMAVPIALSASDWIQLAIATITGIAALAAVMTVWIAVAHGRRRTQPIVVAHEDRPRHFSDHPLVTAWVVDAYLTSEGAGPAFNVRFGVEFYGVRFPYKLRSEDPDSGNVQRVLRPGERRPERDSLPILVDSTTLWSGHSEPDTGRVYWARYENAQGQVWETRNPGDRSARLDIRRVWRVRRVEKREERKRLEHGKRGKEWERKALAELQTGMEEERARDRAAEGRQEA